MAKKTNASTQNQIHVREIRDGVLVLKNGAYRTILMVNAVNFNLKSEDEQQSLVGSYQNFLNGLSFPIQIVVQSRTLDLDDYLDSLRTTASSQSNDLLRAQTNEYINFVSELIGVANIMSKTFYVVIPYETAPLESGNFFSRLFGRGSNAPVSLGKKFEQIKQEMIERTGLVSNGLASLGLSNIQLNTQELIELFYSTYNMDTARRQKLFAVSNVDVSIIQKAKEDQNGTV
jgi:hypothetical protein